MPEPCREQDRESCREAAVLIALTDIDGEEHVLLTQRASHLNIHGGEVAFPGGKQDPEDESLQATALRESYEEVGLCREHATVIGELPPSRTRQGMKVTPFIARLESPAGLEASPDEIHSLFWVPVSYLLGDKRVRTDIFELDNTTYWAPVYAFQGYEIWGFTARVLINFMNHMYDANLSKVNSAPEIKFQTT